jgi:hypothetical protein
MNTLTLPTLHLNGTSRDSLLDGYIAALDALRLAMEALQAAAPNARDYYMQPNSFALAVEEHAIRWTRLADTASELNTLAEHVSSIV